MCNSAPCVSRTGAPSASDEGTRGVRERLRLLSGILAVCACALTLTPAVGRCQNVDGETGELLFNITKFVEWPWDVIGDRNQITFAIFGDDDLTSELAAALSTRRVNGRRVFVRCVGRVQDLKDCQIVYISASQEKRTREVLDALSGRSVLTVARLEGFAAGGGMVEFAQDTLRARFSINLGSVKRAHLTISSRLLGLATIVPQDQ
jgi:hypothetical protein